MSTQNQIVNNAVNQAMSSIDPNAQANIPGAANSTNVNPNANTIAPAPNQGNMSSTPLPQNGIIHDAWASMQERQATAPWPNDWIGNPNVTNRKKKSKTPAVPPLSPQGTQNNTVSPVSQPQSNQDMNYAPQVSENPPMYQRSEQDMNFAPQVSENPPMYQRDGDFQQPEQSDPNDRIGNPNVTPHAPYKYVPWSIDRYLKGIASWQQYDSEQMQTPAYKNAQKRNADMQGLMSKTPQEIAKQISTNPLIRGGRAMRDLLSFDPQRHAQILQEYTKYKDMNDINTSMKRQFDGKTVWAKIEEPNPLQALNIETDALIEESYGKDIAKKMQLREELRNSTYITTKAQAINELNDKKMKLQEQMSMAEKEARAQLWAEAPESLVSAYVNRLSRGLSEQMRTLDMDIMTEQNALQIERDNVKERMDDLNYFEEQKMKQDQINRNIFESDRAFGMQERQFSYGVQTDQRDYNYSVQKDERAYKMAIDEIQNDPKNNMEVSPGVFYNTRTGMTTDLNQIKEQYFQSKENEIQQQADQMFGGVPVTSLEDYATISTPKMKQAISFVEETVKKWNNGSRWQCGAYCNDYLIKMWDKDYKFFQNSLKDKKSKVNSKTPVVGSIMVMDSPVEASKWYGHVAIVKSISPDGNTMQMVDANGFGAGKKKVGEFELSVKNWQYFVNGKPQGNVYWYYVPDSVKSEKTVWLTNQITWLWKQDGDNKKKQQRITEQTSKLRGISPQQNSELSSLWEYLIDTQPRWQGFSEKDVESFTNNVKKYVDRWDRGMVVQLYRDQVLRSWNLEKVVSNATNVANNMDRMQQLMREYRDSWGNMNIFNWSRQKVQEKLWTSWDEQLLELSQLIWQSTANYIREISGTASSDKEVARLIWLLPNTSSTFDKNTILAGGFRTNILNEAKNAVNIRMWNRKEIAKDVFPELYQETPEDANEFSF